MCGRYQFDFSDPARFRNRYRIEEDFPYSEIKTRYNVAPGQKMPIILSHSPNSVELMVWGFIPEWDKSDKPKGFINLRDDTIVNKKWAWKYLKHQRCLVPANGFYEWKKAGDGKIPYYIRLKSRDYFSFAGMYSTWRHPGTGEEKKTYTIITTSPNAFMEGIHIRMPVILNPEEEIEWLNHNNTEVEKLKKLLKPYAGQMHAFPVSTRVNSPSNDDKELLIPTEEQGILI